MYSGTRAPLRAAFITSTPLNLREGSGTFVGIATLADALRAMGAQVDLIAPGKRRPILTAGRRLFNAFLARRPWAITTSRWDSISTATASLAIAFRT